MINWCNDNNGFIQAVLITVYVFATVAICIANFKSSNASRKQLNYQRKHDEEANRARVVPSLRVLEGSLICLCFSNIGHEMGTNLKISFNEEWVKAYERLPINKQTIERFLDNIKRVGDRPFLPPNQAYEVVLFICRSTEFIILDQLPEVEITCSIDSGGKHYEDTYSFFVRPNGSLTLTTDYVRLEKKKADSLEKILRSLQQIERDNRKHMYYHEKYDLDVEDDSLEMKSKLSDQ